MLCRRVTLRKKLPICPGIVCCEMLGQTAVDYYLGKDMILSPKEMQDLDTILARLRNFEPIQYVQGTARFLERSYMWPPAC